MTQARGGAAFAIPAPLPTRHEIYGSSALPRRSARTLGPRAARMTLDPSADIPVERPPMQKRPFDALVDFPCVFDFKVVGVREGDFVEDISAAVAGALETEIQFVKTRFRDKGKYRSITLSAPVNSSNQIYDVYAAIDKDERVKFKF